MSRLFRRDLGLFPRIELASVILGGLCGYVIGEWTGESKMRELMRKERMVDRIIQKANEAKREIVRTEERKNEVLRSLRDLESLAKSFTAKERALKRVEEQLKERERKVQGAEKELMSFDSEKYAYKPGYAGKEKSSSENITSEGASDKLDT